MSATQVGDTHGFPGLSPTNSANRRTSVEIVAPPRVVVKWILKWVVNALGLAITAVPALISRLESSLSSRNELFSFFGQGFALIPGLPGKYLRRCYYFLALRKCSLTCDIGFMSYFSDPRAEVGERVYVGFGVSIGMATLGDGALIGSRSSLLSGGEQHQLDSKGKLTPFDRNTATRISVGEETWIGEAAVLMTDVGPRCIVAAGSVVSNPIPEGCLVGGNPARFIRRIWVPPAPENQSNGSL